MQPFYANFYVVKGKVKDLTTWTGKGREEDEEVELFENEISVTFEKILSTMKEIMSNKKIIFFAEVEDARYLKTEKKFKSSPKIVLSRMPFTAAEIKWLDKTQKAFDQKDSLTSNPSHVEFVLERI